MYRTGHVGAALLAYAPIGALTLALGATDLALYGAVGAAALAMLPDWDQRVPFVTHRGPTHTVWFALAVGVVLGGVGVAVGLEDGVLTAASLGSFGFLVGTVTMGSHLAADALTPAGIRPFAPVDGREYSLSVARAANPIANYALLAIGVLASAGALAVGRAVG